MLTLWCILVAVGSPFLIGLPVARLLSGPEEEGESLWMQAPFIGLAVVVIFLQNLVYWDIRVGLSTPLVWVAALVLWGWMGKKRYLRPLLESIPALPLASAIGVYLLQGLGLMVVGAKHYVGRAWIDQFNYTAIAQFLMDYPFSLSYEKIGNHPYLFKAVQLKGDRIGQSILHGFLATSSFTDAKTMFEPTILLTPLLVILAVYLLSRKLSLSIRPAVIAAVWAGVLPGVTLVHLESFLSQSLAIPLLILWPVLVSDVLDHPNWRNLLTAALVLAAGTSVYTEFYVIFAAVGPVVVAAKLKGHWQKIIKHVFLYAILVAVALSLNPRFAGGIVNIYQRLDSPNVLSIIYPWAFSLEGIERLWFGEMIRIGDLSPLVQQLAGFVSLVVMSIAFCGLALTFHKRRNGLSLAVLFLAMVPLLIRLRGSQHPYQFYKALLSVSPLLTVGAVAAAVKENSSSKAFGRRVNHIGLGAVATLLLLSGLGTREMVLRSARAEYSQRSNAHLLLDPAVRQLQDKLSTMQHENLIIFCDDHFMNGWLTYFGRGNHIWLRNPRITDIDLSALPGSEDVVITFENIPDTFYVLTDMGSGPDQIVGTSSPSQVWSRGSYSLWDFTGGDWVIIADVQNLNGIERTEGGEHFFWVGQGDTMIKVRSTRRGIVILGGYFNPGPSLPETYVRRLLISTDQGYEREEVFTGEGDGFISVPVAEGTTQIVLHPLDKPTVAQLPNGDTRPLLLGVKGLRIESLVTNENPAAIAGIKNPNGTEQVESGEQFFWIGQDDTVINVVSYKAGMVALEGYFLPGPSLPETSVRRLLVRTEQGYEREEVFTGEGDGILSVPVVEGTNRIVLHPLDEPTVPLPNDPRPLLLGVQGMHIGGFLESPRVVSD